MQREATARAVHQEEVRQIVALASNSSEIEVLSIHIRFSLI
jgi:hypothetical protein